MANRIIKQRFTSLFIHRCYKSLSNTRSISSLSSVPLLRPLPSRPSQPPASVQCFTSSNTTSPLFPDLPDIPSPDDLKGCDFKHWLIVTDHPEEGMTRQDIIDGYVKILTSLVGSEEEAKKMIYSVSTKYYYAFGVLMSEELAMKMRDLEKVRCVLADAYLDADKEDYGGEPFIDGEAVPYDPKYHELWVRNNPSYEHREGAVPSKMEGMQQNDVGGLSLNLPAWNTFMQRGWKQDRH